MGSDPYNLRRFVDAQEHVYARVVTELCAGEKRTHWMWFIFPQIAGLGSSAMAQKYAIASRAEAKAYLRDIILGARLRGCTQMVLDVKDRQVHDIFGSPDDMKFRSSMTLFDAVAPNDVFGKALQKYYAGETDQLTLDRL